MTALYFRVPRIRPEDPTWDDRDRFVFSKGHSAIGLHSTMAHRGYLRVIRVAGLGRHPLQAPGPPGDDAPAGHRYVHGFARHGISAAMGMAIGARVQGKQFFGFALVDDGECQEGQVWERAMSVPRHDLDNFR